MESAVNVALLNRLGFLRPGCRIAHSIFGFGSDLRIAVRVIRIWLPALLLGCFSTCIRFLHGRYFPVQMQASIRSYSRTIRKICLDRSAFFSGGVFCLLSNGA